MESKTTASSDRRTTQMLCEHLPFAPPYPPFPCPCPALHPVWWGFTALWLLLAFGSLETKTGTRKKEVPVFIHFLQVRWRLVQLTQDSSFSLATLSAHSSLSPGPGNSSLFFSFRPGVCEGVLFPAQDSVLPFVKLSSNYQIWVNHRFLAVSLGDTFALLSLPRNWTFIRWLSQPSLGPPLFFFMAFPSHTRPCLGMGSWKTQTNPVASGPQPFLCALGIKAVRRTERVE